MAVSMTGSSHREFRMKLNVSKEHMASNFRVEERSTKEATIRALK
jgi:hypothetical protein